MSEQLEAYAHKHWLCECGKKHLTDIKRVIVQQDALQVLPQLLKINQIQEFDDQNNRIRILLIADNITAEKGLDNLEKICNSHGYKTKICILKSQNDLVPDEISVFNLLSAIDYDIQLMIALGSGTINDITRYVSYKTQIPYYIVATAPSMDGYASTVAPLIHNNMKITYEAWGSAAIIADLDMLANSPQVMLAAGLGDLLGKYSALADWYMGSLIEDEYHCKYISDLVLETVDQTLDKSSAIARRDPEAVGLIMNGLIMTGIAMSYAGNSRPASGSEHHLSHFWEMRFLQQNQKAVLHGSKVGLATILTCSLYWYLVDLKPDFESAMRRLNSLSTGKNQSWEDQMKISYGNGADEVIDLEDKSQKNDPEKAALRVSRMKKVWPQIIEYIKKSIPKPEIIRQSLSENGGAVYPEDLAIDRDLVVEAVRYAKELRNRYSVLQLYWDLNIMDEAEKVIDLCYYQAIDSNR